jgi:hypothetical protein
VRRVWEGRCKRRKADRSGFEDSVGGTSQPDKSYEKAQPGLRWAARIRGLRRAAGPSGVRNPTLSVLESVCNQKRWPARFELRQTRPVYLPAYVKQLQGTTNHGCEGNCMIAIDAILPAGSCARADPGGNRCGNPETGPGASLHGELEYLAEAGLTPLEAIGHGNISERHRFPPLRSWKNRAGVAGRSRPR